MFVYSMSLKILTLAIFSFLVLACNRSSNKESQKHAQTASTGTPQKTAISIDSLPQVITAYQKTVTLIGNKMADSSSFNYNCAGEKSGKVTFYSKDNELILVEKIYNEYSHTEGKDQYFIKDGKPFFVFQKVTNWAFDNNPTIEGATIDKVRENRYYIIKGQLVKCLEKQYKTKSTDKENSGVTQTKNINTDCPTLERLMTEYELLLSHQNRLTDMECL